jgi:hypothetical protein
MLVSAAEGFAMVTREGAALALRTAAAVIWPVQTAADAMTKDVGARALVEALRRSAQGRSQYR